MNPERTSSSPTTHLRCQPPTLPASDSAEEVLAHYQQALVDLAQCYDDELTIRPTSSLLNLVILKILIPFATVSALLSTLCASAIVWANARFADAELALAIVHLLIATLVLALWYLMSRTNRIPRLRQVRDAIRAYLGNRTPRRNETLTRNHLVNGWIYIWFVSGIVIVMPLLFYLLRAHALDHLGMNVLIDTAGICKPGSDGISFFRGSDTCASISTRISGMSAAQRESSEIRLDATTTLTIYTAVMMVGILVAMVRWWTHDRRYRGAPPAA